MELKEIATLYLNLPNGEYNVDTKIGNIGVSSINLDGPSECKYTAITINNKKYIEICNNKYSKNLFYEEIHFEDKDSKYILNHNFNDQSKNKILYIKSDGNKFEISNNSIIDLTTNNIYIVLDGIIIPKNAYRNNIVITKNIINNEMVLYIKRFDCKNIDSKFPNNYIKIKDDYKTVVSKYNHFISRVNKNKCNSNGDKVKELTSSIPLPIISLLDIERLELEINDASKFYNEYKSKLTKYHDEKTKKILEYVATILNKYNRENNKKENTSVLKKVFKISNYKNK